MRKQGRLLPLMILAVVSCAGCARHAAQKTAPVSGANTAAISAERLQRSGLPNLGRVTPTLYRGGQPTAQGFDELKTLGVDIVVNFRDEPPEIESERASVEHLGMRYVSIPWSPSHDPDSAKVTVFLQLLRANPEKKIFAHCRRGAERTGVMIATYRMAIEKWSSGQALAEMEEFHFLGFWFRHLKNYVKNFPAQLQTDPGLRPLQLAPSMP